MEGTRSFSFYEVKTHESICLWQRGHQYNGLSGAKALNLVMRDPQRCRRGW